MSKTFRRYEPDQMLLMPVALQEWLPADHLAYFISDADSSGRGPRGPDCRSGR